ncbi:hypothetical protein B296_00022396, partial [Ensete ventricosum]
PVARDIERATVVASVSLPSTPRGPHGKGLPSTCHHASLCLSDPSPIIPIRLSPTRLESVAEAKQSKANAAQSRAKADADTAPSASLSSLSLSPPSLRSVPSSVLRFHRKYLEFFRIGGTTNCISIIMEIVEVVHDDCKDDMVKCAMEDGWVKPSMCQNNFTYKPVQVCKCP